MYVSAGIRSEVAKPVGHFPSDLTWSFNRWRCSSCCGVFVNLPRHPCPGKSCVFKDILHKDRGHRLWAACAADGLILLYCKVCGCSSSSKGVGLVKNCPGRVQGTYGTSAGLARIRRGLHPWRPISIGKPWPVQISVPRSLPCAQPSASSTSMPRSSPHALSLEPARSRQVLSFDDDSDSQGDDVT